MSYTPNTWQTGDTITAAKLNNMEQGIASTIWEEFPITEAYQTTATSDSRGETIRYIPWIDNPSASSLFDGEMLSTFTVSANGVTATLSGVTKDDIVKGSRVDGDVGSIKFNFTDENTAITFNFSTEQGFEPSTSYQVSVSAINGLAPSEDFARAVEFIVSGM